MKEETKIDNSKEIQTEEFETHDFDIGTLESNANLDNSNLLSEERKDKDIKIENTMENIATTQIQDSSSIVAWNENQKDPDTPEFSKEKKTILEAEEVKEVS